MIRLAISSAFERM